MGQGCRGVSGVSSPKEGVSGLQSAQGVWGLTEAREGMQSGAWWRRCQHSQ